MERPATRPRGAGAGPARAWLLGGAGIALLALLAVWLGGNDGSAAPAETSAATAVVETAPSDAATPVASAAATIVDERAGASGAAPADNPFEAAATGGDARPVPASAAAPTADNPFATLDATGAAPVRTTAPTAPADAPRPVTARRTAPPPPATRTATPATAATAARKPARAGARADEPDLLDTLMDNIQHSSTTELPTRDTTGMDRLVRKVNRPRAVAHDGRSDKATAMAPAVPLTPAATSAPTPATATPSAAATTAGVAKATPASAGPAISDRQLRSLLDQCPTVSARAVPCRRNICRQYAPDDKRCMHR